MFLCPRNSLTDRRTYIDVYRDAGKAGSYIRGILGRVPMESIVIFVIHIYPALA